RLAAVERVVRAVAITPLPKMPEIVLGVVNVHGRVLPVLNLRKRFNLPLRDIELSDRFIVARTAHRSVMVVVDTVVGVVEYSPREVTPAGVVLSETDHLEGVARFTDGLLLIHNLDKFLSLNEERTVRGVLAQV